MDVYDTAAVQKIWQRVGLTAEEEDTGVQTLLRTEWELMALWQALPGVCRGNGHRRAAKLRAIHYMQTGQPALRSCPKPGQMRLSPQMLRQQIEKLQQLSRDYRQKARQLPAYQTLFLQFADETEREAAYMLDRLADMV